MLLKAHHTFFSGILCAALILFGCSVNRPIVSKLPSFRLESAGSDSVLLTPAIPEGQPSDVPVSLTVNNTSTRLSASTICSIESGPFRLEQRRNEPRSIQITLPPLKKWLGDAESRAEPSGIDSVEALYTLWAELDELQQKGCFANTSIRDFILQSLPMRPSESSFNAYGYRVGRGGLDLKADMRLKIERAYFRNANAEKEQHTTNNLIGVSTKYMDVKLASDNKIRFRLVGNIRYSPASLAHDAQDDRRDLGLIDFPRNPHLRLLFYTYFVPKEHALSAAIIGATSARQLDELEKQLRAHTDEGCTSVTAVPGTSCFGFDGFVTLSAQIEVVLNGKRKFIDWGSTIKDVVAKGSVKSLRIQRRFMDFYYDVHFDPVDGNVLALALVGGDRLTWSRSPQ